MKEDPTKRENTIFFKSSLKLILEKLMEETK